MAPHWKYAPLACERVLTFALSVAPVEVTELAGSVVPIVPVLLAAADQLG